MLELLFVQQLACRSLSHILSQTEYQQILLVHQQEEQVRLEELAKQQEQEELLRKQQEEAQEVTYQATSYSEPAQEVVYNESPQPTGEDYYISQMWNGSILVGEDISSLSYHDVPYRTWYFPYDPSNSYDTPLQRAINNEIYSWVAGGAYKSNSDTFSMALFRHGNYYSPIHYVDHIYYKDYSGVLARYDLVYQEHGAYGSSAYSSEIGDAMWGRGNDTLMFMSCLNADGSNSMLYLFKQVR